MGEDQVNDRLKPLGPDMLRLRSETEIQRQRSEESFDKTVIALSGGALGVSFTFLDRFFPYGRAPNAGRLLAWAWACWTISLTVVLASHYVSVLALQKTVAQIDGRKLSGENAERAGGKWTCLLDVLNPIGGAMFAIGLVVFAIFFAKNT